MIYAENNPQILGEKYTGTAENAHTPHLLNVNVSYFDKMTDATPQTNAGTFWQIVNSERLATRCAPIINAYRRALDAANTPAEIRDAKAIKKRLPAFTPSGIFERRGAGHLLTHSGLLAFDLDAEDNSFLTPDTVEDVKRELIKLANVGYLAVSASGRGVWGCVPIEPGTHAPAFAQLKAGFSKYGYTIDQACSDVSRLRFISPDPRHLVNLDAEPLAVNLEAAQPAPGAPGSHQTPPAAAQPAHGPMSDLDKLEAITRNVEARRVDLTPNYYAWFAAGNALATSMGEDGRTYFHRLSQFHPKYTPAETDAQFDKCIRNRRRATLATVFHFAKLAGISFYN